MLQLCRLFTLLTLVPKAFSLSAVEDLQEKILGLANKPTAPVFYPECSCGCCTVQKCDGKATHKCLAGDKAKCMTQWKTKTEPGKCNTWVDDNMVPIDCDPYVVWKRYQADGNATSSGLPMPYEGSPPKFMNHMMFCRDFCKADGGGGSPCSEFHPIVKPAVCCPCEGSDMKVPEQAPFHTTLVNKTARDPALIQERRKPGSGPHLRFLQKAHCSVSCCH